MRRIISLSAVLLFSVACNTTAEKTEATATTAATEYPYKINKPDNWDINSSGNTVIALSALKAFEDNKIDESVSYFADTVHWRSDYFDANLSKDSLKAMFTTMRNSLSSTKIDMHDFESVISKDKKEAWVTLWYVQHITDKSGKEDSVALINDFKMDKNKIVELNETVRHFPAKKP